MENKQGLRVKNLDSRYMNKTCSVCKKTYPLNENYFYRRRYLKGTRGGYEKECITCKNEANRIYKQKNKSKLKKQSIEYRQTETGYFQEIFHGMRRSHHYVASEFPNRESVIQHWKEQQKIYGTKCPATGVEMTMIRGTNGKRTMTNISRDRILSWESYTKINTIFTCWKYNSAKNSMTPKDAKAFLRIVKERFGTDEME
jgi:hypothetical protein